MVHFNFFKRTHLLSLNLYFIKEKVKYYYLSTNLNLLEPENRKLNQFSLKMNLIQSIGSE